MQRLIQQLATLVYSNGVCFLRRLTICAISFKFHYAYVLPMLPFAFYIDVMIDSIHLWKSAGILFRKIAFMLLQISIDL
jgi:hypothetical protein